MERSELVHRRHRPVVVDDDLREHLRRRAAGAHAREVLAYDVHRLLHLLLGLEHRFVDQREPPAAESKCATSVPIFSPATARAMLPSSSRLNTTIGRRLSMQRLIAVA